MKQKKFKVDRPYMITGYGSQMTLLTLGNVHIERDISTIRIGGPPRPAPPTQYVFKPQKTGKITMYQVSEGVEEIRVKNDEGLSIYRYFEETNSLVELFDNITSIKELDANNRLIQKGDNYYLNTLERVEHEGFLGKKIANNLYLEESSSYHLGDEIICGKEFRFGKGGCRVNYLDAGEKTTLRMPGGDFIITDEYFLLRRKDLDFLVFSKDGKQLCDPEIKTNIFSVPIALTYNPEQNAYLLTDFGGVTEITRIKAWDSGMHYIYELEVTGANKTGIFYLLTEWATTPKDLLTKEQVYTETMQLDGGVEVYKKFGKWYVFGATGATEEPLGERKTDKDGDYFIKELSKDKNSKALFDNPYMRYIIADNTFKKQFRSGNCEAKDDKGNEFFIVEYDPRVFVIFNPKTHKKLNRKSIHLKVKGKIRLFEYQKDTKTYTVAT